MSRVIGMTTLASGWRQFVFYVGAMCTLSLSAVAAGYGLSESVWKASRKTSDEQQRALSRVEKFLAAKANAAARKEAGPYRPVVALVRPDIHPAVLAAALDRTESASPIEYPEHHGATAYASAIDPKGVPQNYDISSWSAPAVQVAGITCSATNCSDSDKPSASAGTQENVKIAVVTLNAAEIVFATSTADSETFATEPLVKPLPKPAKLGKARNASRQKPSRKVFSPFVNDPAMMQFFVGSGATSLRVAETPGDIIRRTLRGTI